MMLFPDLLKSPTPPPKAAPTVVVSTLGLPAPRQNPWQRSGHTMTGEAMTNPAAALKQAKLNWSVEQIALRCADNLDPVPGYSAIRRSDNNGLLGVVGADYEIFQNAGLFQVFTDLAKVERADGGLSLSIETAGSFQGGRVTWAQALIPDLGIRIGDDESKTYIFVSSSHNGSKALTLAPTTFRIACSNGLRMAEAQARANRHLGLIGGFTFRHTAGLSESLKQAKQAFATTIASHKTTKAAWNRLADVPLTKKREIEFMAAVFGTPGPDETDRARSIRKTREDRIAAILASPTSQVRGTKDSMFSAMQAVVEYADHDRVTRTFDGGDPDESRLFSATFSSGADVKARAWEAALTLAS